MVCMPDSVQDHCNDVTEVSASRVAGLEPRFGLTACAFLYGILHTDAVLSSVIPNAYMGDFPQLFPDAASESERDRRTSPTREHNVTCVPPTSSASLSI